jgi:hypothetical protein
MEHQKLWIRWRRIKKLKKKVSIPRKLEDGWEPIIKMKVNDFDCNALCDLGASFSFMLGLPPLENSYLDVHLLILLRRNLWGGLMMFLLWLTITLSSLISLLWILNAMLLVLLFWEDLFLELLVLLLI